MVLVFISNECTLFLKDFDFKTNILKFKTSRNIKYLQTEKVLIKNNVVYTILYFFDIKYLNNFKK